MDIGAARCTTCHWWKDTIVYAADGAKLGQCRRRAPVAMEINGRAATRYPMVREDDMCGDHAAVDVMEPRHADGE